MQLFCLPVPCLLHCIVYPALPNQQSPLTLVTIRPCDVSLSPFFLLPPSSNWSSPMKIMEPVDKTQHRKDSHAQLETGMRFPFSQATPSLANQPDIGYSMNKTEQLLTNGPRGMFPLKGSGKALEGSEQGCAWPGV